SGDVFYRHKAAFAGSSGDNGTYRWIQFGLNFQGDPALNFILSGPSVSVMTATPSLLESSPEPAKIIITRDKTTGPLVIQYSLSGSSDPATDFAAEPCLMSAGCLEIPSGSNSITLCLQPVNDDLPETRETLTLQVSESDSYSTGAASSASITLEEDDSDSDGMPDDWENYYKLSAEEPGADQNTDDDGFTDLEEYIAGTSPVDGALHLTSGNCLLQEDGPALLLPTAAGRYYTIEYKDGLDENGSWQILAQNLPGTGAPLAITLDGNTLQRFYRSTVQLQP
ncbi:MAG: hypothetical protein V2A34_05070, partial [Lentisphaerota bacterium]